MCQKHGCTFKFYHAECDDELLQDFKDLNTAWRKPQVIIYTSKVTVGSDYTGPCDRVYLAGHNAGAAPRDMIQMMGRVRNPSDTTVRAWVEAKHVAHTSTLRRTYQTAQFHTAGWS